MFDFTQIENGKAFNGVPMPDNIVRVSKHKISISPNIVRTLAINKYLTKAGNESLRATISYDHRNQALQLKPATQEEHNAFAFTIDPNGVASRSNIPRQFRTNNVNLGDYRLVDGYPDVFQLAR